MKKILVSVIAVLCTAALSSCMPSGTVGNRNTASTEVKANEAYAMTAEKAAGFYSLSSMDDIGATTKDSYKANSIRLGADGSYTFNVAIGEITSTEEGSYTIGANGVITFANKDFSIVADGETVVCDGEKLTAEGKLGRSTITMNYEKTTENQPTSEEASENN